MREDLLKGLTPEQIAKVKACKNTQEILDLAMVERVSLTDEQLGAITGGSCVPDWINPFDCPKCGCDDVKVDGNEYICKKCGHTWTERWGA